MRLGIFYEAVLNMIKTGMTPKEAYGALREEGVEGVDANANILGEMPEFDRSGLVVSGVYGFFDFNQKPDEKQLSTRMEKTARAGADNFLCVPGHLSRTDSVAMGYAEEGIRRLIELGKPYGIRVSVEDFDYYASPCCGRAGVTEFLNRIPELTLCLDTGNFLYADEEIPLEPEFLSRVSHVHCKDRCLTDNGRPVVNSIAGVPMHFCAVGEGCIDFPTVLSAVKKAGYDGFAVMEHSAGPLSYEALKKGAPYLREVLRKLP